MPQASDHKAMPPNGANPEQYKIDWTLQHIPQPQERFDELGDSLAPIDLGLQLCWISRRIRGVHLLLAER